MKEHLTPQDLACLTNAQKELLRSLWKPAKNELAVASICTNAETDEYTDIEFVIGQVLIIDTGRYPRIVLQRLRLQDNPAQEEADIPPEDETDDDDLAGDYSGEEDFEFDTLYIEPENFYNLEDCLPLLSIGQMIDLIRKSKFGQRGYKLIIPPEESKLFENRVFRLEDSDEEGYENQELCDLLWDIFKTYVLGVL